MTNRAKGVVSRDEVLGGMDVTFINRNVSEYPVEVGGAAFAPVAVAQEKDISVNVARSHAKQEYERIMQMVEVLQEQAKKLISRLDATEMVHACKFTFSPRHDQTYYVYDMDLRYKDFIKQERILISTGPDMWSSGCPEHLAFIAAVKKKGDSTWEYIENNDEIDP
jgi:hypothetical protein